MAEGVLAAGVRGQTGLELALPGAGELRESTVVVAMPGADEEGIRPRRVHGERPIVVKEGGVGQAEVQQDLSPLPAAERLEMIGQTVLGPQRVDGAPIRRPLDADGMQPSA